MAARSHSDSDATNLVAGDTNGVSDIFIKGLVTGAVTRVSVDANGAQANGITFQLVFSPDGSSIVFSSSASNLVPGDTNSASDIFVKEIILAQGPRCPCRRRFRRCRQHRAGDGIRRR